MRLSCGIASPSAFSSRTQRCLFPRFRRTAMTCLLNGKCGTQAHACNFQKQVRLSLGYRLRDFASLSQDVRFGKRDDHDDFHCFHVTFSCRLGHSDLELLDPLDVDVFNDRDRRNEQFSFLLLRFLELLLSVVFSDFFVGYDDNFLIGRGTLFLYTFPASTLNCVKRHCFMV